MSASPKRSALGIGTRGSPLRGIGLLPDGSEAYETRRSWPASDAATGAELKGRASAGLMAHAGSTKMRPANLLIVRI